MKESTRVLTLDTALYQVGVFRRQGLEFLEAIEPSILSGNGHWRPFPNGLGVPWTLEVVLAIAFRMLNFDPEAKDQAGSHLADERPIELWVQDHEDWPWHRVYWDSLSGLRNNLEAYCLGQKKSRAAGWWKANSGQPGGRNKLLLRVPHR